MENAWKTNLRKFTRVEGEGRPWQYTLTRRTSSIVSSTLFYVVVLSLSFVFIYPMFFIISEAMKQMTDVADATVQWIPKALSWANFTYVFEHMSYWRGLKNSALISFTGAICQVVSCSIVGYGFARYSFPGQKLLLGLVLFTFLVPPQTIVVPIYILFQRWDWMNTFYPFFVPALLGHGLNGALFVLIFIQFFRRLPLVLEEAARIDGAGAFRTFWQIMLPLAKPAMLVVFLFSFVWHWNDVFQPNLFLRDNAYYNLSQELSYLNASAREELTNAGITASSDVMANAVPTANNRIMAASLLILAPVLLLYLFAQRYFVESVERTGIAGE